MPRPADVLTVLAVLAVLLVANAHFHAIGQLAKAFGRNAEGQNPVVYVDLRSKP